MSRRKKTTPAGAPAAAAIARPPLGLRLSTFGMAGALLIALVYLAWISSYMLGALEWPWDDNFMTYIYGRNLAQGYGLRYNATDPVPTEGFSSLLHVLFVALSYSFRIDPLLATRGISLLIFWLIPLIIGLPVARLLGVPGLTVLAAAFGSQILYYLSFSTIFNLQLGMETLIYMGSLACLAGWVVSEFDPATTARRTRAGRVLTGCLALALVGLSRPEGPVLAALSLGVVFLARVSLLSDLKELNDRFFGIVSAVSGCGILAYFLWKKWYFGFVLPNPYYVKGHNAIFGAQDVLLPGWEQTQAFLQLILPWAALGIPLFFLAGGSRSARRALLVAVVPGTIMVLLYARAIHEAAFFHRYEFPYLVFLSLFLVGLFSLLSLRFKFLPPLLVAGAIVWVHFFSFKRTAPNLTATTWLHEDLETMTNTYTSAGRDLARTGLGQRATIALSAAGAIPYYSGFRTIDLLGLNTNFLSGRTSRTIEEVWDFIESHKPDILQSGLPPATPGIGIDAYDPALGAPVVGAALAGDGSELTRFWDREKLLRMVRSEMVYIRDHYTFGGAYRFGDKAMWLLFYVRKDSPVRDRLLEVLQSTSFAVDRESDLGPWYVNDPRQL